MLMSKREITMGFDFQEEATFVKELLQTHGDHEDLNKVVQAVLLHGSMDNQDHEESTTHYNQTTEGSMRVPAHIINEDWIDEDFNIPPEFANDILLSDEEAEFDPSNDHYNRFPSGIHL